MTKKKKRIVSALLSTAILSMGITGAVAFAAEHTFDFRLGRDTSGWSTSQKVGANTLYSNCVNVVPTSGNVDNAPMTITIYNSNHSSAYSNPAYFTTTKYGEAPRNITYTISPRTNESVCLRGKAGYYYSSLQGRWQT